MVGPGDRLLNKTVVSSSLIKLTVCGRWTVEQMGLEKEHKVLWKYKGLTLCRRVNITGLTMVILKTPAYQVVFWIS